MGELLVMMTTMISPSEREVPPTESLRWMAKVLLSKFRLEAATRRPESPPLIFLGQNDLYTRRWAPEVGRGGAQPTRARLGSLARPGGLCPPGGPRLVLILSNNS